MPVSFIAIPIAVMLIILTIHWIRGKKALEIFPDISGVQVLFREKGASGYANDSFITKSGGAQKVLEVVITSDELWIKGHPVFAGIGQMLNLLHKVDLQKVLVKDRKGKEVTITIQESKYNTTEVILILKKAKEFEAVINGFHDSLAK